MTTKEENKVNRRMNSKRWRINNPDKVREYQKEYEQRQTTKIYRKKYSKDKGAINAKNWRINNQDGARNTFLKYTYGITLEQYNQMFTNQNGLCAICNEKEINGYNLCVDHNHETDEIRGLLCRSCNAGLGHFKDSEKTLLKASEYLGSFNKQGLGDTR